VFFVVDQTYAVVNLNSYRNM